MLRKSKARTDVRDRETRAHCNVSPFAACLEISVLRENQLLIPTSLSTCGEIGALLKQNFDPGAFAREVLEPCDSTWASCDETAF